MADGIVQVVVDCASGDETAKPADDATVADLQRMADETAAELAAEADAAAKRAEAMQVVADKAATDPAFAALATLLGISV